MNQTAEANLTTRSLEKLAGRKVMVTGASGFLGSHLCRRLEESGAYVHAVSRSARSSQDSAIQWWQGDTADYTTVQKLLAQTAPDVIFHLAGQVTAMPDLELVLPTFHSILTSTVNLLSAATLGGCQRIILAASLSEPMSGEREPIPNSPYAAAKWSCAGYSRMFYELYGTPVATVRPFMTFGPGQSLRKLIPYSILALLAGEAPNISSGNQEIDWIYVDDVVDGFLRAAQAPDILGCTIDLGSGTMVSVKSIVQELVRLTGARVEPLFGAVADRPLEHVRKADISFAYERLGWKPTTPLLRGLENTVNWYRHHGTEGSERS